MQMHEQVLARINTHVDRGIAGIVDALSLFPPLQTTESCEGDQDQPAWVAFLYGRYWDSPWQPLADFVLGRLGPHLAAIVGDGARLSIRVTESGHIIGEMLIDKKRMADVESAIRKIASEINDAQRRN